MKVRAFKADDLIWLKRQPGHAHLDYIPGQKLKLLESTRFCYTILDDHEEVLLCGGIAEHWPGRGEAWVTLNRNRKDQFIKVHGAIRRFLKICPIRRIEASVAIDAPANSHRWVESLGFQLEAPQMRCFLPSGKDATLYAKVR